MFYHNGRTFVKGVDCYGYIGMKWETKCAWVDEGAGNVKANLRNNNKALSRVSKKRRDTSTLFNHRVAVVVKVGGKERTIRCRVPSLHLCSDGYDTQILIYLNLYLLRTSIHQLMVRNYG